MDKLPNFKKARVLIIGDVMLDRHWLSHHTPMYTGELVPNVKINERRQTPGGAANVASNISSLGAQATLLGITGNDEAADLLEKRLLEAGVNYFFQREEKVSTITKLRVSSHHHQLLRLDFESGFHQISKEDLLVKFHALVKKTDVVILSDYAKGTLSDPQVLIAAASQADVRVLVDPKGDDFTRYKGATLLTPNQEEFENIVGRCTSDAQLIAKAREMIVSLGLEALLITRGAQGMTLIHRSEPELHISAQYREVYDVTGAGDTVIATLAAVLASGESIRCATEVANLAAGIAVGSLGTAVILPHELNFEQWQSQSNNKGRILTENKLLAIIKKARESKKRIVMIYGTFDIVHAGIIDYLQRAKALGDYLIVAVKACDQTVAPLPINKLERRMFVLAALACVDWIIPFGTVPRQLIHTVMPDVLVVPAEQGKTVHNSEVAHYPSQVEVKTLAGLDYV